MRALCHDLIGPAATIDILVQAVYAEGNPDPAIRHRLQLISSEARRISEICRQVLDRPSRAGSVRLDFLTADLLESARSRYLTTIEAVTSPVTLLVHPAVVARILGNLLANACQAAGPDGLVRLQVTPDGEQACVTVADSGAGFGIGKIGRDSLGLEIIGALVLDCGGTVQMGTSDLGGVSVAVTLPCLPQTLAPVRELGVVLAGSAATWRGDADMPA
jgi:signal transduction histidine kinase